MKIELNAKALAAVIVAATAAVYVSSAGAGSLTPPAGAVSPTMTTLNDIGASLRGSEVTHGTRQAGPMAIVELEGETQGFITGDDMVGSDRDVMEIYGFSHEVVSPRDAASGLPTGKRQHKPITVIKELDKSSPLIMNLLTNNESIPTAKFRLYAPGGHGQGSMVAYWEVELVNAAVADIEYETIGVGADGLPLVREHVSFVYQRIIWTWLDGGVTAEDDWETPIG